MTKTRWRTPFTDTAQARDTRPRSQPETSLPSALARVNLENSRFWDRTPKPRDEAREVWDRAAAAGREVQDRAIVNDGSQSMPTRLAALQRLQQAAAERLRRRAQRDK